MAPPPMTTKLQPSSAHKPAFGSASPAFPATTPPPTILGVPGDLGNSNNDAVIITAFENNFTCGWFSGALSRPLTCSTSLTCATNPHNIIACIKKGDENAFFSTCVDFFNATKEECNASGVLCCNSINPSCMTLLWTSSPTRSLVGCNGIDSTWVMLDYPENPTPASEIPVSSSSSSSSPKNAPPSNTSQPPSPSSPAYSATSSSGSNTVTPISSSGLSTYTAITTSSASNPASLLPANSAPSGGLSTATEAGIGVGASAGVFIILALIAVLLFKKHKGQAIVQPEEPQSGIGTGGPLQDNPSGELPADIAPPARLARSASTGWVGNGGNNNDYDMLEGASEVPVDMRGQVVGAVELPGSPVELAPIGVVQDPYSEYQTQASQYRRYSQITRNPQGPVSYRGPLRENSAWPKPAI